jgi:DNA helicase IV
LKRYNPAIGNILFLCYNVSLVNYIKRLLAEKGVSLGPGGVEVHHFFELFAKILGEEIHYEKEEADYYDLVVEETLARLRDNPVTYDAALVDEGVPGSRIYSRLCSATKRSTVRCVCSREVVQ